MWRCKECRETEYYRDLLSGTTYINKINKDGEVTDFDWDDVQYGPFICTGCGCENHQIEEIAEWVEDE